MALLLLLLLLVLLLLPYWIQLEYKHLNGQDYLTIRAGLTPAMSFVLRRGPLPAERLPGRGLLERWVQAKLLERGVPLWEGKPAGALPDQASAVLRGLRQTAGAVAVVGECATLFLNALAGRPTRRPCSLAGAIAARLLCLARRRLIRFRLSCRIGTENPAHTGLLAGAAWSLAPHLKRRFLAALPGRKVEISIIPDFESFGVALRVLGIFRISPTNIIVGALEDLLSGHSQGG